ncbi:hypothetical protein, partial [Bacillus cereus]|uniref:hypothetical protein n=1 Tax=Bacillus cereus TaxID=1396 RepID=UPI00197AF4DA
TLANRAEQSAPLFFIVQRQRLEQSVISLLHLRQKAPLVQEFQCPPVLNEPLLLFFCKNKQETT